MSLEAQENRWTKRQNNLYKLMQNAGFDAIAINPGPTMIYLTGLHFHLSERPTVVLFVPGRSPAVIFPELEHIKIDTLPYSVKAFPYGENPETWGDVFRHASQTMKIEHSRVGVEPRSLRVLELRLLESSAPDAEFISAENILAYLRMRKDAGEIACMQKAVEIAQQALIAIIPFIRPGRAEQEIAVELTLQLLKNGSDAGIPFAPIVASGPNSANPHATPTDRQLTRGDLLVIDWGASHNGYVSDLTRTFAIGTIEAKFIKIAQIVAEANASGRSAVRPGIAAGEIDSITRSVISQAGFGEFFIHRTGHGIGMEGHEAPYLFKENSISLAAGMTFTIEPGIYLPGQGGVRIEDDVVVTENGVLSLSNLPRELYTID